MTVQQLLNNLDSHELTEWLAFTEAKAERDEATRERLQRDAAFDRSIDG